MLNGCPAVIRSVNWTTKFSKDKSATLHRGCFPHLSWPILTMSFLLPFRAFNVNFESYHACTHTHTCKAECLFTTLISASDFACDKALCSKVFKMTNWVR